MKNRPAILAVLALVLIGAFYFMGQSSRKPRFEWEDSGWQKQAYAENSTEPYGTRVFYQLLDQYFPNKKLNTLSNNLVQTLPTDSLAGEKSTYVFVGAGIYLDSADTQHLLRYVGAGNTAVLISKTVPFDLMNFIQYEPCGDETIVDDYQTVQRDTIGQMQVQLLSPDSVPAATVKYVIQNRTRPYNWSYMPDYTFCPESGFAPLGFVGPDSLVNFAAFQYGKGRFLLHSTPLCFSNYHLLHADMRQYALGVLAHLPEGNIYWDAVNRVPEMVTRERNRSRQQSGPQLREDHLLSFVLKREALAWAWYLLLGMGLAYLIFRTQRKQRPIPVLPKNENTSYEFISTIANLHHRSANYKGICIQAMKLFLARVRERYGLAVSLDPATDRVTRTEDDLVHKLSVRSSVPAPAVKAIFDQYEAIALYEPTEQHAIDFYLAMEKFEKAAG